MDQETKPLEQSYRKGAKVEVNPESRSLAEQKALKGAEFYRFVKNLNEDDQTAEKEIIFQSNNTINDSIEK